MDYKRIEELLDKYFSGLSSLPEEAELRDFFRRPEVPVRFRPYQPLFRHFDAEARLVPGPGFDQRLHDQLAALPAARRRRLYPVLARVAAVILLAAGAWWMLPDQLAPASQPQAIDWSKYEPETPEEAYRLTRMALLRASSELNRGAGMAAKEVNKVQKLGKFFK